MERRKFLGSLLCAGLIVAYATTASAMPASNPGIGKLSGEDVGLEKAWWRRWGWRRRRRAWRRW